MPKLSETVQTDLSPTDFTTQLRPEEAATDTWWQGKPKVSGCMQAQHQTPSCRYILRLSPQRTTFKSTGKEGGKGKGESLFVSGIALCGRRCSSHSQRLPRGTTSPFPTAGLSENSRKNYQGPKSKAVEEDMLHLIAK